ncbi:MAG TPA: S28 family serine protease [Bacteroidales bacterium]|nr:S28 family serine protease [Bacteroidales bacterium]
MRVLLKGLVSVFFLTLTVFAFGSDFSEKLKNLENVVSVEELECSDFFTEKYLVIFEQALDMSVPEAGTFKQRVFVCHKSYKSPVVFVTEGYSADYAESANYINELTDILQANQIVVEHRFFSGSAPDPLEWDYLTTKNAADDQHNIRMAFKDLYKGKWVSTGISKGGQTCLLYQMYYPRDVNATVAYVAPVAKALEDGRHEPFIKNIGTKKDRKKILNFQKEFLKRKATIMPIMENYVKAAKLTFRIPLEEIYDYCVLEYSFAFWQWIGNTEKIPTKKDSDSKLFQHMLVVSSPEYFSIEGSESTLPFFYQAARELGYYGYETESLAKYLTISTAEGYFNRIFLPKELQGDFYSQTSVDLENFLKTKARNTIIIYGEYDPWSAAAPETGENKGVIKVINPRGTHSSRIKLLPQSQHELVINTLNDWLK